jgi:hypothetical protein
MIKKKFEQSSTKKDNFEILDVYYNLTLLCPLSKKKIEIPARGTSCQHLECFDLKTYLTLYFDYLNSSADCPICKKPSTKQHLRVDSFIQNILNTSDDLNINLDKDCKWHRIESEAKKIDDEIEVIDLELEKTQNNVEFSNEEIICCQIDSSKSIFLFI